MLKASLDTVRNLYRVGIAFFINSEFYRLPTINPCDRLAFLVAALNGCNIAEINRSTGDVRDDCGCKSLHTLELVDRADQESLVAFFETPAGQIYVLGTDALSNLLNADAELRELLLIDLNLDFILEATADLYCGRALFRFQFVLYLVFRQPS